MEAWCQDLTAEDYFINDLVYFTIVNKSMDLKNVRLQYLVCIKGFDVHKNCSSAYNSQ